VEAKRTAIAVASRRRLLRAILALASASAAAHARAQAGTSADAPSRATTRPRTLALPAAADLAADAKLSRARRIPILLFFDRDDCPYCERALREHLVPMSAEPPWRDDALFRQLEVNRDETIVGFDGRPTSHRALARRYGATLTPTVLVVDGSGEPLSEAVVGLLTADFYGAYLERALKQGHARLRP
jgi:thioredoxin-related protein